MTLSASALTAAHKALNGVSFPTLAKAQEAAHAAILAAIPGNEEWVTVDGDEQGVNARVTIRVDPTDGEDDAFAFEYIGTLGPHDWTFQYSGPVKLTDKR